MTKSKYRRPYWVVLQVACALGLTAIVALSLWWGFLRESHASVDAGIRVQADFAKLDDGATPSAFDGGQPMSLTSSPNDAGAQLRIVHGRLTYSPGDIEGVAAGYVSTRDLGASVKGLGARFVFNPGAGTHGALVLAVSRGIKDSGTPLIRPIPVHLVITALNWNLGIMRTGDAPLEVIAAGDFARPLVEDGATTYDVKISIDGERLTLDLPGTQKRVVDPRIAQWEGDYASFGLYSNHGTTDSVVGLQSVWASGVGG